MNFARRISTNVCICIPICMSGISTASSAGTYPSGPIKLIVSTAPGTASDATARFIASGLSKSLGGTVVVENKVGASGIMATEAVANAPANGQTLLLTFSSHYINQWTMNPKFDALKNFDFLAQVSLTPMVMTTATQSPYKSVQDVVAAAKQKPGKLTYASTEGVSQMAGAYMVSLARVDMLHVSYKSPTQVLIDTSTGIADVAFGSLSTAQPLLESGRLKALAVGTSFRTSRFPAIPTMEESGVAGYELSSKIMFLAPKGTPADIVVKLSSEIVAIAQSQSFREFCQAQVCDVDILDHKALTVAAPEELEKWRKLVDLVKQKPN